MEPRRKKLLIEPIPFEDDRDQTGTTPQHSTAQRITWYWY
jgi:hypothetical protein